MGVGQFADNACVAFVSFAMISVQVDFVARRALQVVFQGACDIMCVHADLDAFTFEPCANQFLQQGYLILLAFMIFHLSQLKNLIAMTCWVHAHAHGAEQSARP